MKRFFNSTFTLMISLVPLFMLQTGIAHSRSSEDPRGYVICDRIKRQGICEEYRINTLSPADRQLITKHCTVGAFCPDENRIGYCERHKDPDDTVFDKHYYSGTKKQHDWDATTIEEMCIQSGGKYHDG